MPHQLSDLCQPFTSIPTALPLSPMARRTSWSSCTGFESVPASLLIELLFWEIRYCHDSQHLPNNPTFGHSLWSRNSYPWLVGPGTSFQLVRPFIFRNQYPNLKNQSNEMKKNLLHSKSILKQIIQSSISIFIYSTDLDSLWSIKQNPQSKENIKTTIKLHEIGIANQFHTNKNNNIVIQI